MRPFEPIPSSPIDRDQLPESSDGWLMLILSQDDWAAWMAEEVRRDTFLYPPSEN